MDEGSESYMNSQSKRGTDKSGGERVVESISLLERRIHPVDIDVVLSTARANIPPSHPQLGRKTSSDRDCDYPMGLSNDTDDDDDADGDGDDDTRDDKRDDEDEDDDDDDAERGRGRRRRRRQAGRRRRRRRRRRRTTSGTTTTTTTMRAAARMCPAWYYLTRIVPLARARRLLNEFDVRARSCPRSPV